MAAAGTPGCVGAVAAVAAAAASDAATAAAAAAAADDGGGAAAASAVPLALFTVTVRASVTARFSVAFTVRTKAGVFSRMHGMKSEIE